MKKKIFFKKTAGRMEMTGSFTEDAGDHSPLHRIPSK